MKTLFASALMVLTTLSSSGQNAPTKSTPLKTHLDKTQTVFPLDPIIIDTHADTPQRLVDENFDLADPLGGGNVNLDSIRKGNLAAEFFSIWVEPELFKGHYAFRTLQLIDAVRQQALRHPDRMQMAYSAEDILATHRQHKFAALMGIEGGHSIENSLGLLRDYYQLGVRYMTLTWSNSTDWADSSGDSTDAKIPHTKEGLSEFGKDVVYEMNRLGMMVDISHVADKTFYRTLVITRAPVIASHSSARALCDAPRNMTDDMLRAVHVNGGVVQVNFYSAFLSQSYRDAYNAQAAERKQAIDEFKAKVKAEGKEPTYGEIEKVERVFADRIPRPPLSVLIDHIDHVAKVAGIDNAGIGTDFDGVGGQLPEGIDSAADFPKIISALKARGYSSADCEKIMGGNLLRVFRETERISRQLQAQNRPRISDKQPFEKP